MKKRTIAISIMALSLLTSCMTTRLRSDIAEFIASFSLSESLDLYQEAGYVDTKIETENGSSTKTVVTLDFNIKDNNNLQYTKEIVTYIDDEISSTVTENIEQRSEKYYYQKTGEEEVEYTQEEVQSLIIKFFYTETAMEGEYHSGGMFYGDYANQTALYFQNYITIDTEKNLYIFEADLKSTKDGVSVLTYEKYELNSHGMLENLTVNMKNGNHQINQNISVYRK